MSIRFIKFLFVGAVNTAFGYGLFALIYIFTERYQIAIIIATVIGVLFNFFTTGRIVFANADERRLIPFILSYVFTLGVNIAALELLVSLGLNPLLAQAICLPFMVTMTYLISARIVFVDGQGNK